MVRRWDHELRTTALAALMGDQYAVLARPTTRREPVPPGHWRAYEGAVTVRREALRHWAPGGRLAVVPAPAATDVAALLGWTVTGQGTANEVELVEMLVSRGAAAESAWGVARATLT